MASKSSQVLEELVTDLLPLLERVDWRLNWEKSVIIPSKKVKFLRSMWDSDGVKRPAEATNIVVTLTGNIGKIFNDSNINLLDLNTHQIRIKVIKAKTLDAKKKLNHYLNLN